MPFSPMPPFQGERGSRPWNRMRKIGEGAFSDMSYDLGTFLQTLLLVVALSTDTLVAAFAYGARSIHISHGTACLMSLVCSLCLGFTLALGKALGPLLDPEFTRWASFLLLFFLGMVRLLDSSVKSWIRRVQGRRRDISFSISRLRFILSVYADPQEADEDCSRSLSPWEAMTLSLALSLDSLAVGFGAGLAQYRAGLALPLCFLCGLGAVALGRKLGETAAQRSPWDLSWLSGALLILLAALRL